MKSEVPKEALLSGKRILMSLALLFLVAFAFSPVLQNGFINFDDDEYVYNNPVVCSGLNKESIQWIFTHCPINSWNPLSGLSHMLDCQLYGLNPTGHHLTSLLLHAAVVLLIFTVFRRMTGSLWKSAIAAALFAVHPLRVEPVAWISSRKDVLSGLFFMLTLLAYTRFIKQPRSWKRHLPLLILFLAGLMSKPMLVTLPFVLLLLDVWPLDRFSNDWKNVLKEKIPLLILAAVFMAITVPVQGSAVVSIETLSPVKRIADSLIAYVVYLRQMVWPSGLTVFYPRAAAMPSLWTVTAALILLLAISISVWLLRKKQPWLLTGWLWYLGMLVPVIGLVQIGGHAYADRFTYLPMIGICIATVWSLSELCTSRSRKIAAGILTATVLMTFVALTHQQVQYWTDSETLWNRTLEITEHNFAAWNGLGREALRNNQLKEAETCFRRAVESAPEYAPANNNLGIVLVQLHRPDEAEAFFKRAIELFPDYVSAHYNYGRMLASANRTAEAIQQFEAVIKLNPEDFETCARLGELHANLQNKREAIRYYALSLQINPNQLAVCNNLAFLLIPSNPARAVELAQRANQLAGGCNTAVLDTLSAAQAKTGDFAAAASTLRRALTLENDAAARAQWSRRLQTYLSKSNDR